jgi:hypothetical protein
MGSSISGSWAVPAADRSVDAAAADWIPPAMAGVQQLLAGLGLSRHIYRSAAQGKQKTQAIENPGVSLAELFG